MAGLWFIRNEDRAKQATELAGGVACFGALISAYLFWSSPERSALLLSLCVGYVGVKTWEGPFTRLASALSDSRRVCGPWLVALKDAVLGTAAWSRCVVSSWIRLNWSYRVQEIKCRAYRRRRETPGESRDFSRG